MSLLSQNIPSATREKMSKMPDPAQLNPSKETPEIIKHNTEIKKSLLEEYTYHEGDADKQQPKVTSKSKGIDKPAVKIEQELNPISFFDLSFFCEERIHNIRFRAQDPKAKKINKLELEFIKNKVELLAKHKEDFNFNSIEDSLYYLDGMVLVPEEYYPLTGFLRKYFKIEKVQVLFKTGEILIRDSKFCNFWDQEKIAKFTSFNPASLSSDGILMKSKCLECNLLCQFRHQQQMAKAN